MAVVLAVAALDRLGRRLAEQLRCREEFATLAVGVYSVRDGGLVSDLTANILASVAQEEVRRLAERVRHALAEVRRSGWYQVTPNLPWGYSGRPATTDERAAGSPQSVLDLDSLAAPRLV